MFEELLETTKEESRQLTEDELTSVSEFLRKPYSSVSEVSSAFEMYAQNKAVDQEISGRIINFIEAEVKKIGEKDQILAAYFIDRIMYSLLDKWEIFRELEKVSAYVLMNFVRFKSLEELVWHSSICLGTILFLDKKNDSLKLLTTAGKSAVRSDNRELCLSIAAGISKGTLGKIGSNSSLTKMYDEKFDNVVQRSFKIN